MKNYTNGIKEHEWHTFCQHWIERRDEKSYSSSLCEYGRHIEFYNRWGQNTIHLRAQDISSGALFEIRLLCADRNDVNYKIVALVDVDGKDLVQEFDCDGESKDGLMRLHYEVCYFDQGDYVVTKQGMVGIFANGSYVFAGVQGDQEYPYQCFCDTILRLANEEERALLDRMLTSKKKRWNQETMALEDVKKKVYAMKPSHKMMKDKLKYYASTSFFNHGCNLVYYCIKHGYNEQQTIEYITKEADKCTKHLNHNDSGAYFETEYKYLKDVLNIDMNMFELQLFKGYDYHYDKEHRMYIYDINKIIESYSYFDKYSNDFHKTLFRDYNEHTAYLFDKCSTKNTRHYRGLITFWKKYDEKTGIDKVFVKYNVSVIPARDNSCSLERAKKEFIESCIGLWHFIKLVDCVENPNNIDVEKEVYKRLDKVDKVYCNTDREYQTYLYEQKIIKKLNSQKQ